MLLDGKLALVTGGGSGIGEGIARAMADTWRAGDRCRRERRAGRRGWQRRSAAGIAFELDVSDRAACDEASSQIERNFGPISVLVNNAGIIRRGKLEAATARADWDATMAVNLDGPYNMVTAFLGQLKATKGSVINIGSIQSFVALPNSAAYTTSKGGVRALTKALAIELSPQGVRVNAIGPGMIATPMNAERGKTPTTWRISRSGSRSGDWVSRRISPDRRFPGVRSGALYYRRDVAGGWRLSGILR